MLQIELERRIAGGEDLGTEFKSGRTSDDEIVEAVACMANSEGGLLLVGVTDDGQVEGHRPGTPTTPDRLRAMIANKTIPSVEADVEFVNVGGRDVAAIEIERSKTVVATTSGKFTRRVITVNGDPECMPMRPSEVLSRASAGDQDYCATPVSGVGIEDLDSSELDRMRRLAAGGGGDGVLENLPDRELLNALRLTSDKQLTVGAILLFGTPELIAQKVPTHEVSFQVLEGLEVRANHIARPPLLMAMEDIFTRISAYNSEDEIDAGPYRVGIPRFANTAIRELVANALVHRDYTVMGSVTVQIDDEGLTVSNPGGFPLGITTQNLLVAQPTPRSPLLADAFKRADLVERSGRGVNRAFEGQLSLGRPAPDFGRSSPVGIIARLRSGPTDRELAGYIAELGRSGSRLALQDLLTLHEVRQERLITTGRAAELFQVSVEEARATLNRLVETGLLESRGSGKGRTYHLAAAVYRQLGESERYVRTRGFEDEQQEQMVLSYVRNHGQITRRQAAELCQLNSPQASRLLRRMRDQGRLELVGARRTARYILA